MPLRKFKTLCFVLFVVAYLSFTGFVSAATIDELNKNIEDRKSQIKKVQEEIENTRKK